MADVPDFNKKFQEKQEAHDKIHNTPVVQQENQTMDLYLSLIETVAEWSQVPANRNIYGAQSILLAFMLAFKSYTRKVKTNQELSDEEMVTLNRMTNDILKKYDIQGFDLIIRRGTEGALQLTLTIEETEDD